MTPTDALLNTIAANHGLELAGKAKTPATANTNGRKRIEEDDALSAQQSSEQADVTADAGSAQATPGAGHILLAQADTGPADQAAPTENLAGGAGTGTTGSAGAVGDNGGNIKLALGGLALGGIALAAGGGGGGGGSGGGTPADSQAPIFSSNATASVAENTAVSTVIHTVHASDNVGVAGYSLAGGADDGKFTLDPTTGELRFKASPDFETPASAAGSNTYTLKVRATDAAGNGAEQTVTVNVTNVAETLQAQLIDSPVSGVEVWANGQRIGTTDANGFFDFTEGQVVTLKIGNVILGENVTVPGDHQIYVQDLLGVNRNDSVTADPRVATLAQLLQSLDADNNPNNGIEIDATRLRDLFVPTTITSTTQVTDLLDIDVTPVSRAAALDHLNDNAPFLSGRDNTPPSAFITLVGPESLIKGGSVQVEIHFSEHVSWGGDGWFDINSILSANYGTFSGFHWLNDGLTYVGTYTPNPGIATTVEDKVVLDLTMLLDEAGNEGVGHVLSSPLSIKTTLTANELFANVAENPNVPENQKMTGGSVSGQYRTAFEFCSASYWHIESMNADVPTMEFKDDSMAQNSYELLKSLGVDFSITAQDLFLPTSTSVQGGLVDFVCPIVYKDGFYVAYNEDGIDKSSVALVGRTDDALFISFRGSDVPGDWMDDFGLPNTAYNMELHYERFNRLIEGIDYYIKNSENGIKHVYVGGHSLGGEMAAMFMQDHDANDPQYGNVDFTAITYEAANKNLGEKIGDSRYVNFEMRGDYVPDLSVVTNIVNRNDLLNYGKTVYLDYEAKTFPMLSHGRPAIVGDSNQLNSVLSALEAPASLEWDQRYYVDDNRDGVVVTNYSFLLDPNFLNYAAEQATGVVYNTIQDFFDHPIESTLSAEIKVIKDPGGTTLKIVAVAGSGAAAVVGEVALLTSNIEDTAEYLYSTVKDDGEHVYHIQWANDQALTDQAHTLVIRPVTDGYYVVPESSVDNVLIANNVISVSYDFNIYGENAVNDLFLIGNDSKNTLEGGAGDDALFGNGGADVLLGGAGRDQLAGGDYKDLASKFSTNEYFDNNAIEQALPYAERIGDFIDGSNVLMGGTGADSLACSNNTDFCIIDYDISNPTASDIIYYFNPELGWLGDITGAFGDVLVFSAAQLGLSWANIENVGSKVSDIFGKTAYEVNASNYMTGNIYGWFQDSVPMFMMNENGYLTFDRDGKDGEEDNNVLTDCITLARFSDVDGGVSAIDGNDILIVEDFTEFDFYANFNRAPVFASASSAQVVENTAATTVVYDANATDNGGASDVGIKYSLLGTDQALFSIDENTGEVRFKASPDYETPTDSGANNVYDFTVRATDTSNSYADRSVALTVTDVTEIAYMPGQLEIDLKEYGKLIAPVHVDGKWYYVWDINGDGVHNYAQKSNAKWEGDGSTVNESGTGFISDSVLHDVLDGIFKYAGDFRTMNPGGDTDNTYRFATINGVKLALPSIGEMSVIDGRHPGTAIDNDPIGEINPVHDDLLAIWDAYNGSGVSGIPAGWNDTSYWSATPGSLGHVCLSLNMGYVFANPDTNGVSVALQVLPSDTVAPAFSSYGNVQVAENTNNDVTVYDATANGDLSITYTLGGTDSALFNINASSGEVTFKASPDFEAPADAGGNNIYDFTVTATDGSGNTANQIVALTVTDVTENAYTPGQLEIDLKEYGKLIAPVQVEGKWYYYWDRSGDGTSANAGSLNGGLDYTGYDVLEDIFTQDINGNTGGIGLTDNTYRYATLEGVHLALPTANGDMPYPYGVSTYQPGTVVQDGATSNATYDELLAIWDAYNGAGTGTGMSGTPPNWQFFRYWSATPSWSGHASVYLNGYVVDGGGADGNSFVALQVL